MSEIEPARKGRCNVLTIKVTRLRLSTGFWFVVAVLLGALDVVLIVRAF